MNKHLETLAGIERYANQFTRRLLSVDRHEIAMDSWTRCWMKGCRPSRDIIWLMCRQRRQNKPQLVTGQKGQKSIVDQDRKTSLKKWRQTQELETIREMVWQIKQNLALSEWRCLWLRYGEEQTWQTIARKLPRIGRPGRIRSWQAAQQLAVKALTKARRILERQQKLGEL